MKQLRQVVLSIALLSAYKAERYQAYEPLRAWLDRPGQANGMTVEWPTNTGRWQRGERRYEARDTSDGVMMFDLDADLWRYRSDKQFRGGWQRIDEPKSLDVNP